MACHCGNEPSFEECCKPYLDGVRKPPTAEALMRSRYSAYVSGDVDYVIATHNPETAQDTDRDGVREWSENSQWEGLDIVATEAGGPDDQEGMVEFIARYRVKGHSLSHHERSSFKRVDGSWYYVDGDIVKPKPMVREAPKVGRNEPCPCGSGKKFKKCHGAA